jgi:thymidylate synthase
MNTDTLPHLEQPYLDLLRKVLEEGSPSGNRTAYATRKLFAQQMRFDLTRGFPFFTTKKIRWSNVVTELLWLLSGKTNILPLLERKNPIWTDWPCKNWLKKTNQKVPDQRTQRDAWQEAKAQFTLAMLTTPAFAETWGGCGPVYGYQWRHWPDGKGGEIDQIVRLIDGINRDPNGRRHIVSAWNVADLDEMDVSGLQPCHCMFQFFVDGDKLSCHLTQRSCDMFLGVPYNVASYSLLTHMVAQVTGKVPHEFVWTGIDVHIYENCVDQAREQLAREPYDPPTVRLNADVKDIFAFREEDLVLENYQSHPYIGADVAV